jgi:hypothetical protein
MPRLHITGDADADALRSDEPLALLIGMLLTSRCFNRQEAFHGGTAGWRAEVVNNG